MTSDETSGAMGDGSNYSPSTIPSDSSNSTALPTQ